jgi:integrase
MKKPPRQRAKKGSVSLRSRGEYLQLRWTVGGVEFSLSAGLNNPLNTYNARELSAQIERDIAVGTFDPSLEKYKPKLLVKAAEPLIESTIELFARFTQARREDGTSGQAIATRYNSLAANLKRFGRTIATEFEALEFVSLLRSRQAPLTANQNLGLLKGFGDWCVRHQAAEVNPFANIKPQKEPKTVSPTRKPFSRDEIIKLLDAAKTHPKLYRWHDFCMVLLYLGLRPSEAIGLRWQDVDLARGEVNICEALARGEDGRASGSSRVRKSTKTSNTRTLPLPSSLLTMLRGRAATTQAKPDSLIFLSPKGFPIDDHSFSQKTWKPLCKAAKVPYRVPYASRHSVISHGIESGALTLKQAQYVAGHSDPRMVTNTYGHMIDKPNLIDWQEGDR